jgi:hypothetical protein
MLPIEQIISPIVAVIVSAVMVHLLTQSREREKAVSDLVAVLEKKVDDAVEAAAKAWTEPPGEGRQSALIETRWRVQVVGTTVESLRVRSRLARSSIRWIGLSMGQTTCVVLRSEMIKFRQALTGEDLFEDPLRAASLHKLSVLERARGEFLLSVHNGLLRWMDESSSQPLEYSNNWYR